MELTEKMQRVQRIQKSILSHCQEQRANLNLEDQIDIVKQRIKAQQVVLNQLVSNGGQMLTIVPEQASIVEVLPMNTVFVKLVTQGHKGVVSLTLDQLPRQEGDIAIHIHYNSKFSTGEALKSFYNKKKCILRPFTFFDKNQLKPKENIQDIDKNLWQPESLYIMCFSNNGCHFSLTANFVDEEEMREKRKSMKTGAS